VQRRAKRARDAEIERDAALQLARAARRNERALIAADIHDDTIQVVTSAVLRVDRLASSLDDTSSERALLTTISADLRNALGRLRRLVFDLDLDVDDDLPLADACRVLAADAAADVGVSIEVDAQPLDRQPSAATRSLLLRNVREALTNAARHAQPTTIVVRVRSVAAGTEVSVIDDGVGFDADHAVPPGHLGLRSMRRRAERAGGRFALDTAPGRGTAVVSWLPIDLDLRAVHEAGLHRGGDRLEPGMSAELDEDVLHVVADRVHAEEQPIGDRLA
jgi:signal transduction histidine kinase